MCGALALAPQAWGYRYILDPNGYVDAWGATTIPMRLKLSTVAVNNDGTSESSSVEAAMAEWNQHLGSVQFVPVSASPGTDYAFRNEINEIVMDTQVEDEPFGSSVLAVTISFGHEADIIFNTAAYTWNSYRGNLQGNNEQDIRRVALHELGHVLALDHPNQSGPGQPAQSVSAIMNSSVSNLDHLVADDIAGGQALYGAPGLTQPNDNFANAITITPGPTPVQVTGSNVASSKEPGEPNHGDDPGGRSVWWKWTAPGNASVHFNTLGSTYDTTIGVYTGSNVAALTTIAGNDDVQNGIIRSSTVTFSATGGTVYSIAVDGFDAYNGSIVLQVSYPAPPVSTAATVPTTGGFTANWSSVNGATGYRLDVSTNNTFSTYVSGWENLDVGNVTSRLVSGLNPNTTYYYRVRAYNADGTSINSGRITTVTVNGPSAFQLWQQAKFTESEQGNVLQSGPNAVYGQDRLPNLIKYALGLEPKTDITTGLPEVTTAGADWIYSYTRPTGLPDVTYVVEVSTNLTTWTSAGVTHYLAISSGDTETWRARYPLASAAKVYFRLKVTR